MDLDALHSSVAAARRTRDAVAASPAGASGGFADALARALDDVNAAQKNAQTLSREFQLENPAVSLEQAVLASQKANIAFQAAVQVRNKLVSAYHDIMNMPV